MQAVRQKWAMLKTYRRIQALWDEYQKLVTSRCRHRAAAPEEAIATDPANRPARGPTAGSSLAAHTSSDVEAAQQRLVDFLDSFQVAYQQLAGEDAANFSLDKLYGDCTEVLLSLLHTVETYVCAARPPCRVWHN